MDLSVAILPVMERFTGCSDFLADLLEVSFASESLGMFAHLQNAIP